MKYKIYRWCKKEDVKSIINKVRSLIFSSIIFIGKEIYDKYKPNPTGFDKLDLFCDYVGWGIGVFIAGIIMI